jgi:hypothetical protein
MKGRLPNTAVSTLPRGALTAVVRLSTACAAICRKGALFADATVAKIDDTAAPENKTANFVIFIISTS